MASQETQILDNIIASRRALLVGGSAALAALALPKAANAALAPSSISDSDILNFALNLEYLEANFYYLAAFGQTIDKAPNAAMTAAGVTTTIGITGPNNTAGGTVTVKTNPMVPFTLPAVKAYAIETAIEEGKHVTFLRNALSTGAVAQPNIDLMTAFTTLATAANANTPSVTLPTPFDPFASDFTFLVGAYIFEDVGVTAYHGAAPLIKTPAFLQAAAGILAVEAYHAGLIRTTINVNDPNNTSGYLGFTKSISALRAKLSAAAAPTSQPTGTPAYETTQPDDQPLNTGVSVSLAGTSATATTVVDADLTSNFITTPASSTVIAYARTTNQILNIVTGGGINASGTKASGVFFPNGLNGNIA